MNRKNASRVIGKKVAAWKKNLPEKLQEIVEGNVIVTGGAIASLLLGEEVNDFDMYFRTKEATLEVAKYYVECFKALRHAKGIETPITVRNLPDRVHITIKSAGVASVVNDANYQYFEANPDEGAAQEYIDAAEAILKEEKKDRMFVPVFMSCNAITLTDKVQIVTRFSGSPDQIHTNYDFMHCMNYWQDKPASERLVLRPKAVEALLAKELRYVGSLYPVCSVIRTRKFLNRGWTINAGQYLKMCWQISQLNLSDPNVMEEQLVGVDAAYFQEVIRLLKEGAKDGKQIDNTYLAAVIERVF